MLTTEERERVRAAVAKAEAGLSAEIVPCVYDQSSPYPEALWAGAGAAMSLACAALFLTDMLRPVWLSLSTLILWVPAAGLAGAAAARWCVPVKRFLIGRTRMEESVARRAKEVFFDVGVSRTAARDEDLVFASLLERRVVVLADEGVRSKVKPAAWMTMPGNWASNMAETPPMTNPSRRAYRGAVTGAQVCLKIVTRATTKPAMAPTATQGVTTWGFMA